MIEHTKGRDSLPFVCGKNQNTKYVKKGTNYDGYENGNRLVV